VCAAESGPAALSIVEEFAPDVAVLDVGLPAMDGYELGARLRALLGAEAPVLVALTGYGQETDRARSEAGSPTTIVCAAAALVPGPVGRRQWFLQHLASGADDWPA